MTNFSSPVTRRPSPIRAIATADNHLGRFYDRISPRRLEERRSYLRQGFRATVDYAINWQAHLFFIAGDLFDVPDPRNVDRSFVARCLSDLRRAGIRVFAVGGNHDTPRHSAEQGGWTPQEVYSQLGALHYFEDGAAIETQYVEAAGYRVAIGGLGTDPAWEAGKDPLDGITWDDGPAASDISILLLHGQVGEYATPDTREPVFSIESLERLAANLYIVGDIHRPATRRIGGGTLVIPGATERMTFGEDPSVPGFVTLELSPDTVHHERIALPGQPREELEFRAADLDPSDPLATLIAVVSSVATPETMVRLKLTGVVDRDRYHALSLRQLNEAIAGRLFSFTLDTSGLLIEDEWHGRTERGVRVSQQDEIAAYTDELLTSTGDPVEQTLIREARERLLGRY